MVLHLRVFGRHGEYRTDNGTFTGLAEKSFTELTPEMKLGAKQQYHLLVNTVGGKALTLVRSAEKCHGIAAWKRSRPSTSQTQPDGTQLCSWRSCSLAGTLAVWRTHSWTNSLSGIDGSKSTDGMKIAVLASHPLESIHMWSDWQQAQRTGSTEWCVRTRQRFSSSAGSSTKMGEELGQNPTVRARHRWTLTVGKGNGKGYFVCECRGHAAKDRKPNQGRRKGQSKGKGKGQSTTDNNSPASAAAVARKATNEQIAGSD